MFSFATVVCNSFTSYAFLVSDALKIFLYGSLRNMTVSYKAAKHVLLKYLIEFSVYPLERQTLKVAIKVENSRNKECSSANNIRRI